MHTVNLDEDRRIGELEDELKAKDRRISELRSEIDELRDLNQRLSENIDKQSETIEQWKEGFEMTLNDKGEWSFADWLQGCQKWRDKYFALLKDWNAAVASFNAKIDPQNVGRPLAASEAQVATVRKLRKQGKSLRWIAEETSLGLNTVRTIVGKMNGTDRTSRKNFERIYPDRTEMIRARRVERARNNIPRRLAAVEKQSAELRKEVRHR